jgi:hypothetical protein
MTVLIIIGLVYGLFSLFLWSLGRMARLADEAMEKRNANS